MHNWYSYPKNWAALARACKERANWACEQCGAKQYEIATSRTGHPYVIYLHAAHINHDARNPEPDLKCLCPSCHGKHDFHHRVREQRVRVERLKHRLALNARGILYGG